MRVTPDYQNRSSSFILHPSYHWGALLSPLRGMVSLPLVYLVPLSLCIPCLFPRWVFLSKKYLELSLDFICV